MTIIGNPVEFALALKRNRLPAESSSRRRPSNSTIADVITRFGILFLLKYNLSFHEDKKYKIQRNDWFWVLHARYEVTAEHNPDKQKTNCQGEVEWPKTEVRKINLKFGNLVLNN